MNDRHWLKEAARVISDRAKVIASVRSRRIPAATSVGDYQGDVAVITNGHHAPNAAPFEAAELHPLWGRIGSRRYDHSHWGKQPLFPYMTMAAHDKLDDAAMKYLESALDELRNHGWQ